MKIVLENAQGRMVTIKGTVSAIEDKWEKPRK